MKKKFKLKMLNVKRGSTMVLGNDIHFEYEYQNFSESEVSLFFHAYVGDDEKHYRFVVRGIYRVYLEHTYHNENDRVKDMISRIIDSVMNVIYTIDAILKSEEG